MLERHYHYLLAGLPDLVINDKKLPITLADFRQMLNHILHPDDVALTNLLFLPFDHHNLINTVFHHNRPFDERATFSKETIDRLTDKKEQELEAITGIPTYIVDAIRRTFSTVDTPNEKQLQMMLLNGYYQHLTQSNNPFLAQYANYDQQLRNVTTALSARKHNIDIEFELIGNDEVTDALKKSRLRDFGLSSLLPHIDTWVQLFDNPNLIDREMMYDTQRWLMIDNATRFNYFTIENVMAYTIKLIITERWMQLDNQQGRERFLKLLSDIANQTHLPEATLTQHGK